VSGSCAAYDGCVATVELSLTASGDVGDYTADKRSALEAQVASRAGVLVDKVVLNVVAASVRLIFLIQSLEAAGPDGGSASAASVRANVEANLQTASAFEQVFADAGLASATVETQPSVVYTPPPGTPLDQAVETQPSVVYTPPPGTPLDQAVEAPGDPEGGGLGGGAIAGIVIGIVALVGLVAGGLLFARRRVRSTPPPLPPRFTPSGIDVMPATSATAGAEVTIKKDRV